MPSPPSKPATNVLLKRSYLHAAGVSPHQPKYSLKRCNLHVAFNLRIVGVDVHHFLPRMNVTRQTSRRPHRAPNQQPKYSSNGPIFMQLAPHSTDQSTLLNGSIFMLHLLLQLVETGSSLKIDMWYSFLGLVVSSWTMTGICWTVSRSLWDFESSWFIR